MHVLVLCTWLGAYCFVFWGLPGDVLAAPESALCGWEGFILSGRDVLYSQAGWKSCNLLLLLLARELGFRAYGIQQCMRLNDS